MRLNANRLVCQLKPSCGDCRVVQGEAVAKALWEIREVVERVEKVLQEDRGVVEGDAVEIEKVLRQDCEAVTRGARCSREVLQKIVSSSKEVQLRNRLRNIVNLSTDVVEKELQEDSRVVTRDAVQCHKRDTLEF